VSRAGNSPWSIALQKLVAFGRIAISGLAALGVALYGLAALVTVADILGRRVGMPIEGVVDLVQLFFVGGAWLVLPYAFMVGSHVGVDFVLALLPRALNLPLRLLIAALAFALVALMLWQGYETFLTRTMFGDRSQQLGIPVSWYWYPLLVGLTVSLAAILIELAATFTKEPSRG
jgi:TRAP-type C4-dicarboxylate transport system permease small subunit